MQPRTFVIADSNVSYRCLLRQLVAAHPHWSIVAETDDGTEAVGFVTQHRPDVVLIDVNLSGIGGIEAARRIRAVSPHAWILVLSGYHDEEFRRASLEAGADYYLDKEDLDIKVLAGMVSALRSLPAEMKHRAEANAD